VTRRIEADGPRDMLPWALLDLIEAYSFGSQGHKSFVTFARVLRLWDESPELFDQSDQHNLFWEFKWVAGDLGEYPQITTAQAEAFLADMRRRYELAGHGLSAVRKSAFHWASDTGRLVDAEAQRLAWLGGGSDEFDDCRACTIGSQVAFFLTNGRYDEAVELALTQQYSCNREPTVTHHAAALAALLAGQPVLAVSEYRKAVATLPDDRQGHAITRGRAFELLARGGHLDRALRNLRAEDSEWLVTADTPLGHLRFLVALLAGLSANLDQAEMPTGLRASLPQTVGELHAFVLAHASERAAQFDARDANTFYADRISTALAATRAEQRLDFDTAPPAAPTEDPAPVVHHTQRTETETPEDVFAAAERLSAARDYRNAVGSYASAGDGYENAGYLDQAGLAFAEAAQCAVLADDDAVAHTHFARATALLTAGGADADIVAAVLAAWAPIASRMDDVTGLLTAANTVRVQLLAGEPSAVLASVRDTTARTLAAAPPAQVPPALAEVDPAAEATAAGELYAQFGQLADAAHAFWLAGRVLRDAGRGQDGVWALESAFEGFSLAHKPDERIAAAGDLIDLLRATGQADRADDITAQLTTSRG
jgi:hypothetical protein